MYALHTRLLVLVSINSVVINSYLCIHYPSCVRYTNCNTTASLHNVCRYSRWNGKLFPKKWKITISSIFNFFIRTPEIIIILHVKGVGNFPEIVQYLNYHFEKNEFQVFWGGEEYRRVSPVSREALVKILGWNQWRQNKGFTRRGTEKRYFVLFGLEEIKSPWWRGIEVTVAVVGSSGRRHKCHCHTGGVE